MAGERLPARSSLRSQLLFRWTGKCFETGTSHMQTVRTPKNERVAFYSGYTCKNCNTEMDKYGYEPKKEGYRQGCFKN
jgi:hypothetical protein